MIKAKKVIPHLDFKITVTFEDNRVCIIDMNFIFEESGPVIDPLKTYDAFKNVTIVDGIVTWPTGYDIDPEYLLELASQMILKPDKIYKTPTAIM